MKSQKRLNVFLCHAKPDKPIVREYYKKLVNVGIDAWLDDERLLPGQDWKKEIPNAIKNSDVVIVFLSWESRTREGYVNTEIKHALDIATEKPEGEIFLVPARLEDCEVPDSLEDKQYVNLFENDGFLKLLKALNARAISLGVNSIDTTTNIDSPSSNVEVNTKNSREEVTSLLHYLKGLDYLHKKEPTTVRSVLTLVNMELVKPPEKKKRYFQDLAVLMLENFNYDYITSAVRELSINPETRLRFSEIIGYQSLRLNDTPSSLVKDFMEQLYSVIMVDGKSKISDMIDLIKSDRHFRYIAVISESNRALQGAISVNDINRNIEVIKNLSRDTLLLDLPFFNNNPKVIYDSETMEDTEKAFRDSEKAGRKVTVWIVVNNEYVPVGQISEMVMARWAASRL